MSTVRLLQVATFLRCGRSKFGVRFGASCRPALGHKRVLANGGLLEVHLGAFQQAVVDFKYAA